MPRKRQKTRVCMPRKYTKKKTKYEETVDVEKPQDPWPSSVDSIMSDILLDVDAHSNSYEELEINQIDEEMCSGRQPEVTDSLPEIHNNCQVNNGDQTIANQQTVFEKVTSELENLIKQPYVLNATADCIHVMEFYSTSDHSTSVKLSVAVDRNFVAKIFVHQKEVPRDNDVWSGLPHVFDSSDSIMKLLEHLSKFSVCIANPDPQYQEITPVGSGISDGFTGTIRAYREGNFSASNGTLTYSSTIRSVKCHLLVKGNRCTPCLEERRVLRKRHERAEEKKTSPSVNYIHSKYKHKDMNRENLLIKINQQKTEIKTLSAEVEKLKRQCNTAIQREGVTVDSVQDMEFKDLMSSCQDELVKSYPNPDSFQRLFWEQQLKHSKSGKYGMRWHPMIIRWCLYIRSKSSKAYDAMRDSGFIQLPSSRTLFDYSHYTTSALGFQPDIVKMLQEEAKKQGMLGDTLHKDFVGLLFDEIRIKEDLVYDKHSGELIGYCDLGSIGNQIMELEKTMNSRKPELAKFMLVLMVRGITTNLKFPFAGFATNSITADFLYPIVWKAVSILECHVKLKVLFCTCDGASANRRFFQMHKLDNRNNEPVYYTINPFDPERNLYFISDVPHLLKTARNCFSNSYSHKNTRKLWRNGKDISWMSLVRLFEEHCEIQLYSACPKLTRNHIDLTSFNYMKVNLAAQIMSDTVANALEFIYGEQMSETVLFIRNFNKFFDCLNVRSLYEGRNKRNDNLNPFNTADDERLEWLKVTFLNYFQTWKDSVEQRPGDFTASQKQGMQLSIQTLNGLKISVNSITECVKFMLDKGANFILTHRFNQDPLEQHFGHLRHKGGSNNNPTVYEARNIMNEIRAVGAQALKPRTGNITHDNDENRIDNSNLHRRR